VQYGPVITRVRSTTRTPASGNVASNLPSFRYSRLNAENAEGAEGAEKMYVF
jgi:hypothetical protein